MYLAGGTFAQMAEDIKLHNRKVVLFGAGVIGTSTTPAILEDYGLVSSVVCYVDNDTGKWGSEIRLGCKNIQIYGPGILNTLAGDEAILVNISRSSDIIEQLQQLNCTKRMICYIIPIMCIFNFRSTGGQGVIRTSDIPIIPKKIHYMWLGKDRIPENLQWCINSWRRYCPEYEIIRWDESNYDIGKCSYMKQAYQNKKYGFVPDYARLDILYHHGGIYMDTDVELLKNLDSLLCQEAFTSVEKWQVINFGGCSGAVQGSPSLKAYLSAWEQRNLVREDGSLDDLSSGYVDTRVALDNGYVLNGKNQTVMGMNIYTYDYFHPYDYMSHKFEITDDTYAIHHFNGGWLDAHQQFVAGQARVQFDHLCEKIGMYDCVERSHGVQDKKFFN